MEDVTAVRHHERHGYRGWTRNTEFADNDDLLRKTKSQQPPLTTIAGERQCTTPIVARDIAGRMEQKTVSSRLITCSLTSPTHIRRLTHLGPSGRTYRATADTIVRKPGPTTCDTILPMLSNVYIADTVRANPGQNHGFVRSAERSDGQD